MAQPTPPGYQTYQQNLPPGWLQGPFGLAWSGALGAEKDWLLAKLKAAIVARYPDQAQTLDAIAYAGLDRGIQQGPTVLVTGNPVVNESLENYLVRLQNPWGAWQVAGAAWGMLAQLNAAGYTTAYILQENGYVYGPAGGTVAHTGTGTLGINGFVGVTTAPPTGKPSVVVKVVTSSSATTPGTYDFALNGGAYTGTPYAFPNATAQSNVLPLGAGAVAQVGTGTGKVAISTTGQQVVVKVTQASNNSAGGGDDHMTFSYSFDNGVTYTAGPAIPTPAPLSGTGYSAVSIPASGPETNTITIIFSGTTGSAGFATGAFVLNDLYTFAFALTGITAYLSIDGEFLPRAGETVAGDLYTLTGVVIAPDPVNGLPGYPPPLISPNATVGLGAYRTFAPQPVSASNLWATATPYPLGQLISPNSGSAEYENGYYWVATTPGTSSGTQPAFVPGTIYDWPSGTPPAGHGLVDGGVTWWPVGYYTPQATTIASGSNGATLPQGTIHVASTEGFPAAGTIIIQDAGAAEPDVVQYTNTTSTTFTGCTGGTGTMATGNPVIAASAGTAPSTFQVPFVIGSGNGQGCPGWPVWQASKLYGAGQVVTPAGIPGGAQPQGAGLWRASVGGTAGSTEPAFIPGTASYTDGSITWVPFTYPTGWNVAASQVHPGIWNRWLLVIDPVPLQSSWVSSTLADPPTSVSQPSTVELNFLSSLIKSFGAGAAQCGGILVHIATAAGDRGAWGWPLSNSWASKGGFTGGTYPTTKVVPWSPSLVVPVGTTVVPSQGGSFAASTMSTPGAYTGPTSNALLYYYATVGGTTGEVEPAWTAGTYTDGTVHWAFSGTAYTWGPLLSLGLSGPSVVTFPLSSATSGA